MTQQNIEPQVLPASAGLEWWKSGIELVRRNPLPLILGTFLGILPLLLISLIPRVGAIVASVLAPCFMAGLIALFRSADKGEKVSLESFLLPAKARGTLLLLFGVLYFVGYAAVMLVLSAIGGDAIRPIVMSILTGATPTATELAGTTHLAFLIILAALLPLFMAYWFAPFLITWHRQQPIPAALGSVTACLKNWKALLLNAGIAVLGMIAISIVIGIFGVVLGFILPATISMILVVLLMIAVVLAIYPLMFANYYFSYKTIFPEEASGQE